MSAIGTDRLCRPGGKHFCCWTLTGGAAPVPVLLSLTQMYGPAVRRKRCLSSGGEWSCINVGRERVERRLAAILD
jgi:hypothetical protein